MNGAVRRAIFPPAVAVCPPAGQPCAARDVRAPQRVSAVARRAIGPSAIAVCPPVGQPCAAPAERVWQPCAVRDVRVRRRERGAERPVSAGPPTGAAPPAPCATADAGRAAPPEAAAGGRPAHVAPEDAAPGEPGRSAALRPGRRLRRAAESAALRRPRRRAQRATAREKPPGDKKRYATSRISSGRLAARSVAGTVPELGARRSGGEIHRNRRRLSPGAGRTVSAAGIAAALFVTPPRGRFAAPGAARHASGLRRFRPVRGLVHNRTAAAPPTGR